MQRLVFPVIGAALAVVLPGSLWAQKVAVGPQFQVNTYTTGNQGGTGPNGGACGYWDGRQQAVASDPAGNFIVVWSDGEYWGQHGQDGSDRGVFGQRYDSAGFPIGGEFQVNTYTTGDQRYPRVAADSAGNFVVVWNGQSSLYGHPAIRFNNIRGRRYASDGTPQGPEFEIETPGYPDYCCGRFSPRYPAVDIDGAGRFIVVWDAHGTSYGGRLIFGRRYDSTGATIGGEFQVSEVPDYETAAPDVNADAAGGFVVVWHTYSYKVMGRRFDGTGTVQGAEFEIQPEAFFETFPRVAGDDTGAFVVVWSSSSLNGYYAYDYTEIAARRYDSTGSPIGSAFQVNAEIPEYYGYEIDRARCPDVAVASDGRFVVVWQSLESYPLAGARGLGRQFDSAGNPLGAEFLFNTDASQGYTARSPAVATDTAGNFVVVWTDMDYGQEPLEVDGDGLGVFGQRFGDPGSFTFRCWPTPRPNCRRQTKPRGAFRFKIASTSKRNNLAWRWPAGEATTFADFGEPFASTDYALCVYDGSTADQPILQGRMPAGGTCNLVPCWTELAPPGKAIRYLDQLADPDGIQRLQLRAGDEGRARVGLRGRGTNLELPALPLTAPVTVQLQASNGLCITAEYDQRIIKNTSEQFRARPGSPSGAFLDEAGALFE